MLAAAALGALGAQLEQLQAAKQDWFVGASLVDKQGISLEANVWYSSGLGREKQRSGAIWFDLIVRGARPSWILQCRTNSSEIESYTAA